MSDVLESLFRFNQSLLERLNVPYQQWQHEPILDFETDVRVASQLGWTGTHSKSLFLKIKGGGFALYLTDKDSRLDSKAIKSALGKRASICSDEEMTAATGCIPGALCPFGLDESVILLADKKLLDEVHTQLLYTPGHPESTFGFESARLADILDSLPNPVIWL